MNDTLDLFSGIGGFALAVDAVWDDVEHIFCEIDPYCRALLKLRFKGAKIYGDIRKLRLDTNTDSNGCTGGEEKVNATETKQQVQRNVEERDGLTSDTKDERLERPGEITKDEYNRWGSYRDKCFILTGGFPCQPFSQAGKRKGTSDNRYLWPEMLRVIREFQPTWVIAENVRGILTIEQGMVFEQVCLDLEREGYEVQPFIIPAVSVNAPHRRDRVWFVANCISDRSQEQRAEQSTSRNRQLSETATDTNAGGIRRHKRKSNKEASASCGSWESNWLEIATELCRMDDGLPAELDGLKLSKSKHREERLKALGNAIVPQVAIEIMKAIRYSYE